MKKKWKTWLRLQKKFFKTLSEDVFFQKKEKKNELNFPQFRRKMLFGLEVFETKILFAMKDEVMGQCSLKLPRTHPHKSGEKIY